MRLRQAGDHACLGLARQIQCNEQGAIEVGKSLGRQETTQASQAACGDGTYLLA